MILKQKTKLRFSKRWKNFKIGKDLTVNQRFQLKSNSTQIMRMW